MTYRRLRFSIPQDEKKNYTSFKDTDEVLEAWKETEEVSEILLVRVIVIQSPASFTPVGKALCGSTGPKSIYTSFFTRGLMPCVKF
nr:hypothetical protein [Desulfobacterales bacterium]